MRGAQDNNAQALASARLRFYFSISALILEAGHLIIDKSTATILRVSLFDNYLETSRCARLQLTRFHIFYRQHHDA